MLFRSLQQLAMMQMEVHEQLLLVHVLQVQFLGELLSHARFDLRDRIESANIGASLIGRFPHVHLLPEAVDLDGLGRGFKRDKPL